MNYIENIEAIHPDVIDAFIRSGSSEIIPAELQGVLKQMVFAAQIYSTERNIMRAARKLQTRSEAELQIKININTAKSRIYAAISYFDIDCNVEESVWLRDYANKYEDLVQVALVQGRSDIAERCLTKAMDCRLKATASDRQSSLGVVYILSDNLRPEDLEFTTTSKKGIARKANDGVYSKIINSLNVSTQEKKRLKSDADIEDVEYEDIADYGKE